jgi:hypothetical protein
MLRIRRSIIKANARDRIVKISRNTGKKEDLPYYKENSVKARTKPSYPCNPFSKKSSVTLIPLLLSSSMR